jgi:hypothetical protein
MRYLPLTDFLLALASIGGEMWETVKCFDNISGASRIAHTSHCAKTTYEVYRKTVRYSGSFDNKSVGQAGLMDGF